MYLKTPKRYSNNRRRRYLFSYRRVLGWLVMLAFIVGGWWLYRQRATLAPVVSQRAVSWYQQGNQIVETITAPTPLPTENPANVVNRADANWLGGRVEDAIVDYAQAVEMLPNDVVTHYRYALALIIEGRYSEALTAAENAVTADPYSSDAWAIRALAQVRTGNPGSAIASGLHALELNPENATAYAYLTEAYLELNQVERAQSAAEKAIELNPDSAEAYYARAQIQQVVNYDFPAAIADYMAAYDLARYWTDAAVAAANLEAVSGNPDAAIEILNRVKDANPDNSSILLTLGIIYNRDVGNPNQAADVLARCINVDENSAGCHFWYGRVLLRLEQYAQAAEVLDRAVNLTMASADPDPRYHYWAGEAHIYLGNCPAALPYLRAGYDIASEDGQTTIASDLQGSIRECSAFDGGASTPMPTLEPESEAAPDADATPNA